MIENVDLTLKILEHFARDDVGYPANLTVEHLKKEFPDEGWDRITYHVRCAEECGLLEAQINEKHTFDGAIVNVGYISGLTASGGEYVRNARSKFRDEAKNEIIKSGLEVTTSLLAQVMGGLIARALG